MALFWLNHEIAKTRDMVSDTNLGLIRLQWWRDEIDKIYRHKPYGQVPVLSTLQGVVHAQAIPQAWFDSLLYAREFDLMDKAPENWEGLRHYAEFVTLPLNQIALRMMGQTAREEENKAISTNFGLFECIRSVPKMLSKQRCYIPESLLDKYSLNSKKIIDFNYKKEIVDVIKTMCESLDEPFSAENLFLKRQQAIISIYLKKFKKINFDIFSPEMKMLPPFYALRLALTR